MVSDNLESVCSLRPVNRIYVAEFDVDEGARLLYIYPKLDEQDNDYAIKAESMLPDSTHLREKDSFMISYGSNSFESSDHVPFAFNVVRLHHSTDAKRGAIIRAFAITSKYPWIGIFEDIMNYALEKSFDTKDCERIVQELYRALQQPQYECTRPPFLNHILQIAKNHGAITPSENDTPSIIKFLDNEFEIDFSAYTSVNDPVNSQLADLIETFSSLPYCQPKEKKPLCKSLCPQDSQTHPIVILTNALLLGKRVLFFGQSQSAKRISDMVYGAVELINGGIQVFSDLEKITYPHVNLTNVDLLINHAYVAGTMNPVFANRPDWWDVLCNIDTKSILISSNIADGMTNTTKGSGKHHLHQVKEAIFLEKRFIEELNFSMLYARKSVPISNASRAYILGIVELLAAYEHIFMKKSALLEELDLHDKPNINYLTGMNSKQAIDFISERETFFLEFRNAIQTIEPKSTISKLLSGKSGDLRRSLQELSCSGASVDEWTSLFKLMTDMDPLNLFISVSSISCGWNVIANGLFHHDSLVRRIVVKFFERFIEDLESYLVNSSSEKLEITVEKEELFQVCLSHSQYEAYLYLTDTIGNY